MTPHISVVLCYFNVVITVRNGFAVFCMQNITLG